ncbi:hypothetical protein BsWGS_01816 [Bradybaena similaris]
MAGSTASACTDCIMQLVAVSLAKRRREAPDATGCATIAATMSRSLLKHCETVDSSRFYCIQEGLMLSAVVCNTWFLFLTRQEQPCKAGSFSPI